MQGHCYLQPCTYLHSTLVQDLCCAIYDFGLSGDPLSHLSEVTLLRVSINVGMYVCINIINKIQNGMIL